MNPIDELFRKKLDGEGLRYSDGQWEQMERVLEKEQGLLNAPKASFSIGGLSIIAVLTAVMWSGSKGGEATPVAPAETVLIEEVLDTVGSKNRSEALVPGIDERVNTNVVPVFHTDIAEKRSSEQPRAGKKQSEEEGQLPNRKGEETDRVMGPDMESVLAKISKITTNESQTSNENIHLQVEVYERSNSILSLSAKPGFGHDFGDGSYPTPYVVAIPDPSPLKWELALSTYGFTSMHSRQVSGVSTINAQKSRETPIRTNGYGMGVSLKKGRFGLKLGLENLQLKEKTNYLSSEVRWTYDTSLVLVKKKFTQTPGGLDVALLAKKVDSTAYTHSEVRCRDCEVRFRYINVPVSAQYEWRFGRLGCFAEAGIDIALLQSSTGQYVLGDLEGNGIDSLPGVGRLESSSAINKVLYRGKAALGVRYHFNSKCNLWMSCSTERALNSMLTSYDQRANLTRGFFGIEIKVL